ncbi:MAG: Tetratricopeptide repeat-containing protein [Bacteroidetes bacterium]|nr:Tetratricopeptide repeat-containing protein [Bacteroidota bacterium]
MKTRYALLLFIVIAGIAAVAQTQGSKKQTSASQESHARPAVAAESNTEEANDGVLHSTAYGKKWMNEGYMSEDFRKRINNMSADVPAQLPYPINQQGIYTTNKDPLWHKWEVQTYIPHVGWTRTSMSDDYVYVARLRLSANFHTFIFAQEQMVFKDEPPVTFFLTNVDTNGYFLSSLCIGQLRGMQNLQTSEVSADGVIHCHKFKQVWEKDPLQYGYENNSVKERVLIGEKTYQITSSGDIVLRK